MPLIFQKRIYREDLQANPHITYVFGDNEQRTGMGGQAGEMRGEPNAFGIPTKKAPNNHHSSFWSDVNYNEKTVFLRLRFFELEKKLYNKEVVVFPLDGIGTGLSDLPNKAPRIYAYVMEEIEALKRDYQ